MKKMIHLVRHATSESNLDLSVNLRKPDHAIELAPFGHAQALEAGRFLASHIVKGVNGLHRRRVQFVVSPYRRTRQTEDGFAEAFRRAGLEISRREEGLVREQSFGLFDGIPYEDLPTAYPVEWKHYAKHLEFEGEHFAPMPLGESQAMVCDRVRGAFAAILDELTGADGPEVSDVVVFTHGVTKRAFIKEWMRHPWTWMEAEPICPNCSIATIIGIPGDRNSWRTTPTFPGFDQHAAPGQERREEGHA